MPFYEFKVIPAPRRGEKARGVKTTEERYALTLTALMNELGREGWDYVRADTLPVDERVGFTGSKTSYQHMLVFRRVIEAVPVAEADLPAFRSRLVAIEEEPTTVPKLGPAGGSAGVAPAVGPASAGVAAE
jgi:hypothetical protein